MRVPRSGSAAVKSGGRSLRRWLLSVTLVAVGIAGLTAVPTAMAMPSCKPIAEGDSVHGPTSGDASGHGWWLRGNCSSPAGQVGIAIFEKWNDGQWHEMNSNIGTVYSGGGSGRWVNTRTPCKDGSDRYWKSEVSIVVTGGTDTTTTPEALIPCRG